MRQPEDLIAGLRCYDIHSGLRNVDPNSPTLAPLSDMREVGMTASLAALIRGQDVIADADALKTIAADQLDISPYAFNQVISRLERVNFVYEVQRNGNKVASFVENVPFHEDLYRSLGESWRDESPSQLEEEMVTLVDRLAHGPVPTEELEQQLGLDRLDIPRLLEVGKSAELMKSVSSIDGEILYSPFFGFEIPKDLSLLFEQYGSGRLTEELTAVRNYQGIPLDEKRFPALADAVTRGFVLAPSVRRPDQIEQPFASIPYLPDPSLLTVRKPILEKALAVLACIRCGQHFGGATSTKQPARVLNALLDPSREHRLTPHSSHKRQYQLLYRMQVVDFIPSGNWVIPQLIVTPDNLEAVRIARDLLLYGEPIEDRAANDEARELLALDSPYQAPMQTVHRRRGRLNLGDEDYRAVLDAAMGRAAL